ncbi:MAG: acyl-CoA thioesterase [Phycisphaerae bacterium]|nr:acyl-CoA thioesterase [Phycisphaerae bacterium]
MDNHKLVLPEHLNHYGYLFGGHLLQWVDEYAWIAATLDYPGRNFVTVAMDRVEFRKSVRQGTILRVNVERVRQGTTSVEYEVRVFRRPTQEEAGEDLIFGTHVTLVSIDEQGRKRAL